MKETMETSMVAGRATLFLPQNGTFDNEPGVAASCASTAVPPALLGDRRSTFSSVISPPPPIQKHAATLDTHEPFSCCQGPFLPPQALFFNRY